MSGALEDENGNALIDLGEHETHAAHSAADEQRDNGYLVVIGHGARAGVGQMVTTVRVGRDDIEVGRGGR